MTPRLNYVLKEMNKLPKICAYSIPRPMRDYINEVEEILRKTIEDAVACYADKKSLVTHLCIVYSDKVLRYDQQFFNSLDLLCESHGYICRVRIILGKGEKSDGIYISQFCRKPSGRTTTTGVLLFNL